MSSFCVQKCFSAFSSYIFALANLRKHFRTKKRARKRLMKLTAGFKYILGTCHLVVQNPRDTFFGETCKNETFSSGYPVSIKPLVTISSYFWKYKYSHEYDTKCANDCAIVALATVHKSQSMSHASFYAAQAIF